GLTPPPRPAEEPGRGRRVPRAARPPRLGEPLLQVGDRRRVVIVEVRARREDLDHLESVRRDRLEVIAGEAFVMKEVRGHPERSSAHGPNSLCYSSARW